MLKKTLIVMAVLILLLLLASRTGAAEQETYSFGNYWQTYELDGEKSPLEWLILDETDDAYLLITKYSIDANIFNHNNAYTTWSNSAMRKFLNSYFYNECFSEEEKERILLTTVKPDVNDEYKKVPQGSATKDYVFLLSAREAIQYFATNDSRIAYATPFATIGHARIIGNKWAGAYTSFATGATCWRLRTMGMDNYHACTVHENGTISMGGDILFAPHYAVRPCIWIRKGESQ